MKFKLIEKLDYNEFSESILSQYLYDAVDELENASLERYIEWFRKEIPEIDQPDEDLFITCIRDAYIQLIDYGEIAQPKTMISSQLKEYIESHTDIIDDTDELMRQCPKHLQHELKIVLSKLDESLTEELLTEDSRSGYAKLWSQFDQLVEIGLDKSKQDKYQLHHIHPNVPNSTVNGETNYAIIPSEVHARMPIKNNPVELYRQLKSEFKDCFETITVSFDVLILTDEARQELINKINTNNQTYKREQDKLRKRAKRQLLKLDKQDV